MRLRSRGVIAWSALDLATCLILVIYTLIAPPPKVHHPPAIETMGVYAITISWANNSNNDIDLYVQDPQGNIVYFSSPSVDLMHLEHDDRGTAASGSTFGAVLVHQNNERVVIRGTSSGEYVVNVHFYAQDDVHPEKVKVQLIRLAGADRVLTTRNVTLGYQGDQKTAFRFTLNQNGYVTGYSSLPKDLVYNSLLYPAPPSQDFVPNTSIH